MKSYKIIVDDYTRRYINNNGEGKYKRIVEKIKNSNTFKSAMSQSLNNHHALLAGDFQTISEAAMSFLSGPTTGIMGSLIALEIWDEVCNTNYRFLNEYELMSVAESCVNRFGKGYR